MQNHPQQPQTKNREGQTLIEYTNPQVRPVASGTANSPTVAPPGTSLGKEGQAAAGLAQMLGLDPRVALLTVVLDTMLFAGEIATVGILIVFSLIAGVIFGFITYRAQISWYGDNHDSALIKALIMGLLTAIPTALPAFLYVPAGIIGLFHVVRRK